MSFNERKMSGRMHKKWPVRLKDKPVIRLGLVCLTIVMRAERIYFAKAISVWPGWVWVTIRRTSAR